MIQNVMEIRWNDLQEMDMNKTVLFIGIAPIEEHGRHLPLGVDIYETQFWMDNTMKKLENEFSEYTFITLPVIPYGHAVMNGFRGNIHLSQKLFYDLILATLRNVVEWGVKNIIVISGHADPRHTIAIEQACESIKKESGVIAFAPMGAIFSGKVLLKTEDAICVEKQMKQFSDDFHAGWIETSNMLEIRPDLVHDNYKDQPDIKINGRDMIIPQVVSAATKDYGHLGCPKEASKEIGRILNEWTIQRIMHCVAAYLRRTDYDIYEHHQLYNIPSLRVKEEN
ncbi:creatininase family protein [Clostridium oryzae]|uniref:Creatinine amidohydrolase n=1 Tax=Clostridium oryzae TaxID=1450648 RepID=A0A1V4IZL2_9CLOT|nr:creatininase family protein [Clostridium oryzae]OPJ65205.1 creatinine amidohydrolase [Clostridium oryzae]